MYALFFIFMNNGSKKDWRRCEGRGDARVPVVPVAFVYSTEKVLSFYTQLYAVERHVGCENPKQYRPSTGTGCECFSKTVKSGSLRGARSAMWCGGVVNVRRSMGGWGGAGASGRVRCIRAAEPRGMKRWAVAAAGGRVGVVRGAAGGGR